MGTGERVEDDRGSECETGKGKKEDKKKIWKDKRGECEEQGMEDDLEVME